MSMRTLHESIMREAASTGQPSRLTFAQRKLLQRLIAAPGSGVAIVTRDRDYDPRGPSFRGRFCHPPCPTCKHSESEPVSWRVIFALDEAGFIKPTLGGDDYYNAAGITELGRAALADSRNRR